MEKMMTSAPVITTHLRVQPVPLPASEPPWPEQGHWTYQDYLRLPEDGNRYEIIYGVLYMAAAPRFIHQYIVKTLIRWLDEHVEERNLGVVIPAPFEVRLPNIATPAQPDVTFLRREEQPAPEATGFDGIPALVVEILSASSVRTDRVTKFAAYEDAGVPEYWIIDPKAKQVEVYHLTDGIYRLHGQYSGSQALVTPTFADLALLVEKLFPESVK